MSRAELSIVACGIRKNYGGVIGGPGLNGFDLQVRSGTVCGLLGPNGSGKTTAVKILSTLLELDAGYATVAGFDVKSKAHQVRRNIGLVGQYAAIDEILSGRQNLVMFGRLHHLSSTAAQKRADELLEQFGLTESAKLPAGKYSGGMRRRLDIAASLLVAPPVLFVDEPTTGLDPVGRREVWTSLRSLVTAGTTLLLTTQYLEEADQLADQVAILNAGRIIAEGTPDELKSKIGGDWLEIVLTCGDDVGKALSVVQEVSSTEKSPTVSANRISVPVADRSACLIAVATALSKAGVSPLEITVRRPTLDEVFICLTTEDKE